MMTLAVAWPFSDDYATLYVLPALWMTSHLPIIGKTKAQRLRRILKVTYWKAASGTKSDA